MSQFRQAAIEAGFSIKQVDFLETHVADHTHDAEEINGLEEFIEGVESEEGDGDEEEED